MPSTRAHRSISCTRTYGHNEKQMKHLAAIQLRTMMHFTIHMRALSAELRTLLHRLTTEVLTFTLSVKLWSIWRKADEKQKRRTALKYNCKYAFRWLAFIQKESETLRREFMHELQPNNVSTRNLHAYWRLGSKSNVAMNAWLPQAGHPVWICVREGLGGYNGDKRCPPSLPALSLW